MQKVYNTPSHSIVEKKEVKTTNTLQDLYNTPSQSNANIQKRVSMEKDPSSELDIEEEFEREVRGELQAEAPKVGTETKAKKKSKRKKKDTTTDSSSDFRCKCKCRQFEYDLKFSFFHYLPINLILSYFLTAINSFLFQIVGRERGVHKRT